MSMGFSIIIVILIIGIYTIYLFKDNIFNKKQKQKQKDMKFDDDKYSFWDGYSDIKYTDYGYNNTKYDDYIYSEAFHKNDNITSFVVGVLRDVAADFKTAKYFDKYSTGDNISFKYVFEDGSIVILTDDQYLEYSRGKKGKRAKLTTSQVLSILKYFKSCVDISTTRPNKYDDGFYDEFYDEYKHFDYFYDKYYNSYKTTSPNVDSNSKKYTPEQIKYQGLYIKLKNTYDHRMEQINKLSKYDKDRNSLINESNVVKIKMMSAHQKSGLK